MKPTQTHRFARWALATLLLCTALTMGVASATQRVALLVGNAAYAQAPLVNPVNDARAMAQQLTALGFQVTRLENASKRDIERAIVDFEGQLGPDTTGLFYYAGHGVQVRGRNYLVPVDAAIESESHVRIEAVDVDMLTSAMDHAGSKVNFIILDACRNNPFERRLRGASRGLAAVDAAAGTLIAYATAPGSVAEDGDGRNGVYTEALLDALSRPGLQAEQVFKQVRVRVAERTAERQIPWESSSLTGNFVFNQSGPPAGGSPPPLALAPPLAQQASSCADVVGAWSNSVPGTGCESIVHIFRAADGGLAIREDGCASATGTARLSGRRLDMDWAVPLCTGHTTVELDASCDLGRGEVVMPANFLLCAGRHAVTMRRLPDDLPRVQRFREQLRRAGLVPD